MEDQDHKIPDLSDAQTPSSKLLDKAGDFTVEVIKARPGVSAQMEQVHKFHLSVPSLPGTDGRGNGE